ncbi:hypothetical protein [Azorhizobium caulinodans]|uniref:hypothetical protein n=1 Tax=Azorhizobium caulinodans TaxID=7 RepID=UPI002FBE2F53
MLQRASITNDPNDVVVDLDPVDHGPQVSLSKWNVAGGDALTHLQSEGLDHLRGNLLLCDRMRTNSIQRGLGTLPIQLQVRYALFQEIVEFSDAVLNEAIEAG